MTDVVMPQMGESIVEGTLTKWLKKPGERVERDEPLFEISTDKVDTEIPSPAAGTLAEVLVEEGKTVGINTVVAPDSRKAARSGRCACSPQRLRQPRPRRRSAGSSRRRSRCRASNACRSTPPAPQRCGACRSRRRRRQPKSPHGPLSPLVRKMARENNIDLSQVQRHRRGRPHHEAGCRSVHGAAGGAQPLPRLPPARSRACCRSRSTGRSSAGRRSRSPLRSRRAAPAPLPRG